MCLKPVFLCVSFAFATVNGAAFAQSWHDLVADMQVAAKDIAEIALAQVPQIAALAGQPVIEFVSAELGSGRVVKGAPYTATAVSETTQTLMDGNRIQRRSTQRLARDGEGRTRTERVARDGTVVSVVINDVVAQRRFVLTPARKSVLELPAGHAQMKSPRFRAPGEESSAAPVSPAAPAPPHPPASMSSDEARSWAEQMRAWAHSMSNRWRTDAEHARHIDRDGQTRTVVRADGERRSSVVFPPIDGREIHMDVVRVIEAPPVLAVQGATPAIAPMPPLPPLPLVMLPPGDGVTTSLGTRDFDGVRSDGTRTTWTIAAGRVGNDKPIEVFSERWYAPELMLVVHTRHFDPRSGETTYRLTDLKRGEPDAALFKVPEDYEQRGQRRKQK